MKLTKLIKRAHLSISASKLADFTVRGVTCNSKAVKKDYLFIAIKGNKFNGTKFIDEARRRGAKAVISSSAGKGINFIRVKDTRKAASKIAAEFYGNPSMKIKVIGITGTNGKTTISYLLEKILKVSGKKSAVLGTINYRYNNKIIPSNNTTPGPFDLQRMFADMVRSKVTYCVMEVSSHALHQDRTEGVKFSSAIFTNLAQDHLDYHKTLLNYFQAKSKLFRSLGKSAFAVINNDDKYAPRLKKLCPGKVITYGIDKDSQVMARNIKFGCSSTEFILKAGSANVLIKTRLIGKYNVYNILAVIAWALKEGIHLNDIKRAIEGFSLVPGRLEKVASGKGFSVFVDYAHTEDALKNIIQSLRQVSGNRIIVVFGCGGDRDKTKRPKMGYTVTELSDYAIITSDNPRSEDPKNIICDIERGIRRTNYSVVLQRAEAIKKSLLMAKRGDIVIVAGKGHENYQVLKNKTVHFDDREVIKSCLKQATY